MLCTIKFFLFVLVIFSFGFSILSQIGKIRSLLLLIPISFSFGTAFYIFICHILSFFLGPQLSVKVSLTILLIATLIILILKIKKITKIDLEVSTKEIVILKLITLLIFILTFLSIYKIGAFDKSFHTPLGLSMHHNNIYPPQDMFRPEYLLLYHYGGDLLAIAIYEITKVDILRAYELVSTLSSGVTFLSFVALAWVLTKKYSISLISGFCSYFGGGFLWLDAILRYIFKKLPEDIQHLSLLETFVSYGIHGSIINAPSVHTFVSTFALGNPLLIASIIIFWKIIEDKTTKTRIINLIFLNILLFSLFLSAEWLYLTFWAGVLPFLFVLLYKKQNKEVLFTLILLTTSFILNKSIGNVLFLQEGIQHLGRTNIFNVEIKKNIFEITTWGRFTKELTTYQNIPVLSWDFISEFGLSFFLFPFVIIYLTKTKNLFATMLFLIAVFTMPLPLLFDFKTNPADFNRLFAFGNTMIITLITCGIYTYYKYFLQKKALIIAYILTFILSPFSGILFGSVFTPYIANSKEFANSIFSEFKKIKSPGEVTIFLKDLNKTLYNERNQPYNTYKEEINFLIQNSKPKDVAISNIPDLPLYAGVYTTIPGRVRIYKDQVYSSFDTIYTSTLGTLDPYLLTELNIKWLVLINTFRDSYPQEKKEILQNKAFFELVYTGPERKKPQSEKVEKIEIYKVNDLKEYLKNFQRKTGWLLVDKIGQPIEISVLKSNKITLFPTSKEALLYLKQLYKIEPGLKKELITSQAGIIEELEKFLKANNLGIILEKKF